MDLEEEDMTNLKAQDQEVPVSTPSAQMDTGHDLTDRILTDSIRVDGEISHVDQQDNFILLKTHHMHMVLDLVVHGGGGLGLI